MISYFLEVLAAKTYTIITLCQYFKNKPFRVITKRPSTSNTFSFGRILTRSHRQIHRCGKIVPVDVMLDCFRKQSR